MFYITSTPWWLKSLFPKGLAWKGNEAGNNLHLTFDDGPHPEITPFVLDILAKANAKATFFCIGENVELYPEVFAQIIKEGHRVGNHTQTHPDGWSMPASAYLQEIKKADASIKSDLFRPPYGKITKQQVQKIRQAFPAMKIIMWSCVTGDFDTSKNGDWCARQAIRFAKPGSIIVFHDSEKAFPRLEVALPAVLNYMAEKGLISAAL